MPSLTSFLLLSTLCHRQEAPIGIWNQVNDTYSAFATALRSNNSELAMSYLTPDSEWTFDKFPAFQGPQIEALLKDFMDGLPEGDLSFSIETLNYQGDSVKVQARFMRSEGGEPAKLTGRWSDTWHRTADGWKLQKRSLLPLEGS